MAGALVGGRCVTQRVLLNCPCRIVVYTFKNLTLPGSCSWEGKYFALALTCRIVEKYCCWFFTSWYPDLLSTLQLNMSALTPPTTTCGCSHVHWAIVIVLLSVAIGPGHAMPRPPRSTTQLLFSELLGGNEDNTVYGEQLVRAQRPTPVFEAKLIHLCCPQQKQQEQRQQQLQRAPSFVRKWPSLRDLLLMADYDDFGGSQEEDVTESRLLARLHKLSDNGGVGDELRYNVVNDLTNVPSKKVVPGHSLKEHNTKKNVQCEYSSSFSIHSISIIAMWSMSN